MRCLLVPVDHTEISTNAARYAADLALAIDADIHLLHVVAVPVTPAEIPAGFLYEQLEKDGATVLKWLYDELRARTKEQVTITTRQEIGGVAYVIAQRCKQLQPFAVVMGAPQGSFWRAIGGSPAIDAARHLPYPVLVVPANATFHRIGRIVLAAEPDKIDTGLPVTIAFLKQLRDLFAARFDVINVEINNNGGGKKFPESYHWKEALSEIYPELHFLQAADLSEGINQYLGKTGSDWLMVFPQKHPWLEFHKSRSARLVAHSQVPVLSICDAAFHRELDESGKAGAIE